jgi:hypothetical protein
MAIDFSVKDVIHKIAVKFIHAFLPEAKKPYNLRAVHQPELDVHGIASKADVYNIGTSPKVIEEGMNAGMELIHYLVADGFKIKTPLFTVKLRVPGEYDGSETRLPHGVHPVARLQTAAAFRKYLQERVQVEFDGVDQNDGLIAEAKDEATGLIDEVATMGNILTVHGYGLKIEGDEAHKDEIGLFFDCDTALAKAEIIAVNEPRTLKVIIPAGLVSGKQYRLKIVTQSSAKHSGTMLKETRTIQSDFTLTAQ